MALPDRNRQRDLMRGGANLVEDEAVREKRRANEGAGAGPRSQGVDGKDAAAEVIEAGTPGTRRQLPAIAQVRGGHPKAEPPASRPLVPALRAGGARVANDVPLLEAVPDGVQLPARLERQRMILRDRYRGGDTKANDAVREPEVVLERVRASRDALALQRLDAFVGMHPGSIPDRLEDRVEPHRPRTAGPRNAGAEVERVRPP